MKQFFLNTSSMQCFGSASGITDPGLVPDPI